MRINLAEECKGAKRIGISGHVRPDGDCVGAVLALQMYLNKCVPGATVQVFLEKPADIFKELKGVDEIISDCPDEEPFDVFFALDCNEDRLEGNAKYFQTAKKKINIDHHVSNKGCGDVNCVVPEAAAACEVLYDLMDKELLDQDIAMALYIGIIHDTGVFQYSNTTEKTMMAGAKLITYGFDYARLIQETFYQKTYVQMQIMGRALMESVRFMDGRCIVSVVDKKTMDFYGAVPKDLDGIVSQLRNIKGIECAIFMYQTGPLEYKVSMRSSEKVNVSQIASFFGGGGHVRAAGCTMQGNFHDVVNNLSLHIEKELEK